MEPELTQRKVNSSGSRKMTEKGKVERSISQNSQEKLGMEASRASRAAPVDVMFWVAVGLSQAVGLTILALVGYWCHIQGGFAWSSDAELQFYYHPLLMVMGLVFFYGDAILIYRVLSFVPKKILKVIHGGFHVCAIVCSSVALVAVLENHRRTNRANFYSLHSWLGITTFGFFCLQYIGAFVTFLFPGLPERWRARILPFHTFFGLGLFLMAVATVEMGITEKLIWSPGYTSGIQNTVSVTGNILGLFVIVFAFLIVFITTHAAYKRKPLPAELQQTTVN